MTLAVAFKMSMYAKPVEEEGKEKGLALGKSGQKLVLGTTTAPNTTIEDQKTKRPKDQKTKRPKDQKTKRPKDQKNKRTKEQSHLRCRFIRFSYN